MEIREMKLCDIKPYSKNPRFNEEAVSYVMESIQEFGFKVPIVLDKNNEIVAGHTRYLASKRLKLKTVPCIVADDLSPEQVKAFRLADNKVSEFSTWNMDLLMEEIAGLDLDMTAFGFNEPDPDDMAKTYEDSTPVALRDKFIVPPFSVLDARNGDWQKRKKSWLQIINSGDGREENIIGKGYWELAKLIGVTGTSIFDPVLCEVLYHWFSPKDGKVLDPFAGGSVRGIVASYLGREYYGNDLRPEQIQANLKEYLTLQHNADFFGNPLKAPKWSTGDSKEINEIITEREFDMLFTCPPYGDLEIYSDLEEDLSNMEYEEFIQIYGEIFKKSVAMLKENAFIVVVVGEIRDKQGYYRNFIGDTIKAVEATGAKFYNEAVLITMAGTASLRATRQFEASRKVCNVHQKALVFLKSNGDDKALREYIEAFEEERQLTDMKKSILVFLKGNAKLAKADIEQYLFDVF